jgi:hypothetical protein
MYGLHRKYERICCPVRPVLLRKNNSIFERSTVVGDTTFVVQENLKVGRQGEALAKDSDQLGSFPIQPH